MFQLVATVGIVLINIIFILIAITKKYISKVAIIIPIILLIIGFSMLH